MFKKKMSFLLATVMMLALFSGCSSLGSSFKVGMVTDSGSIEDKMFNEITWKGVEKAGKEFKATTKYLKPTSHEEASYLTEIGNLYDAGFHTIVTPGYLFKSAITIAQDKYPEAEFITIDFAPEPTVGKNTVSILFADHQSGFIAGAAAALQMKTGEFGGVFGVEIPPVQKYNWGFQQGVKYANENYGTTVSMKPENFVYIGSFNDAAKGEQLAAEIYDRGVKTIFVAAGLSGSGAITEAKARRAKGDEVWTVGADVDQYSEGLYDAKSSVMLTSATKCIETATYDMIKASKDGKFPGGQTIMYDAALGGVGIPKENPNLADDVTKTCAEILVKIKSGALVVSEVQGDLIP